MTTRQTNRICLGISLVPFLLSVFLQHWLINYPVTHFMANESINPVDINKQTFIFLLLFGGFCFYLLSIAAARTAVYFSARLNIVYTRFIINIALSILSLLLIIKNMK